MPSPPACGPRLSLLGLCSALRWTLPSGGGETSWASNLHTPRRKTIQPQPLREEAGAPLPKTSAKHLRVARLCTPSPSLQMGNLRPEQGLFLHAAPCPPTTPTTARPGQTGGSWASESAAGLGRANFNAHLCPPLSVSLGKAPSWP